MLYKYYYFMFINNMLRKSLILSYQFLYRIQGKKSKKDQNFDMFSN